MGLGLILLAGLGLAVAQVFGDNAGEQVFTGLALLVYCGLGGLIIFRRDGHLTGWLLALLGLALVFADGFTRLPGVPESAGQWVASWVWTVVFSLYTMLTLTFPSGHLPRQGRAATVTRAAAWSLPVLVVMSATTETLGGPEESKAIPNPVGFLPDWVGTSALLGVVVIFLSGVAWLVMQRRRAKGAERAQLTWVVFALLVLVVAIVATLAVTMVSIAIGSGDPGDDVWIAVFLLMIVFPLAFGVAILRYRLFDIDRIVSRTVSYAFVVGLLTAVFFGSVTALSGLLPAQSDLVIASSTLAVAALFNPVRLRVQAWVDKRFNRSRFDAQRVAYAFADSLRDQIEVGEIVAGWIAAVDGTMRPTAVGVWVKDIQPAGLAGQIPAIEPVTPAPARHRPHRR